MLKKNIWKPDTCECVLEYEWDDELSEDQRVHKISNVVKYCKAHDGLSHDECYNKVLSENKLKNKVLASVLTSDSLIAVSVKDEDGNSTSDLKLKAGITYSFSFDSERKLAVDFHGATLEQKTDALQKIDNSLSEEEKLNLK